MSDLLRYPQPDGSTKVIDPATGDISFENKPVGRSGDEVINLPEPKPEPEAYKTLGEAAKERPQPDAVEELAAQQDKRKGDGRLEFPPGCPEFQSILRLDYRSRANAMILYQAAVDAWQKLPQAGTILDTSDKIKRYWDSMATFDDLLMAVAVSPQEYRQWQRAVQDDSVIANAFFAYVSRFGLGESESSSG